MTNSPSDPEHTLACVADTVTADGKASIVMVALTPVKSVSQLLLATLLTSILVSVVNPVTAISKVPSAGITAVTGAFPSMLYVTVSPASPVMTNSPSDPGHTLVSVADTVTADGNRFTTIEILCSSGQLLFNVEISTR